uniref:Uncharacterized protein n=1 Tax=Arundo donax TaxID=35708 RepID=A0A0A9HBK8_ARUDO
MCLFKCFRLNLFCSHAFNQRFFGNNKGGNVRQIFACLKI